jgi:uncharacterized protein (DUF2235 family)
MPRNLVVCSDGTGNTFDQHVSNVSRLVHAVALNNRDDQLVFYDQGIGTNPSLVKDVKTFKDQRGSSRPGLEILDGPKVSLARPLATLAGLSVGYGLYANLREMYQALATHYTPDTDLLFLFGFSRGAFTVRALAGLIYRCGLPARQIALDDEAFRSCFSQAYAAYQPHRENRALIDAFRKTYQAIDVDVDFLGIWDTVKSYGGLRPQSLPHLRHNPIVRSVCHALALDERRSWFLPTSWGGIDGDAKNAATLRQDARYQSQRTKEVWFVGCHSDIGGGDEEAETAKISFRWMLGEATTAGLLLDPNCERWIFERDDPDVRPTIHESYGAGWWMSDRIPRWELDNSTRPPGYPFKWRGKGRRSTESFRRNGHLYFHSTSGLAPGPGLMTVESVPALKREEAALARDAYWRAHRARSVQPRDTQSV